MANEKKVKNKLIDIPEGKIQDYLTGEFIKDSEQEQVRQNFERTLVEEYNYDREDISCDEKIKVYDGNKQKSHKVPLVVYDTGKDKKDIYILIQTAPPKIDPTSKSGGTSELEQWLIETPTAEFACWTNGVEALFFQKKKTKFEVDVFSVNDVPRKGEDSNSIYTTDRRRLRVATGNNLLYAFRRCHDYIHGIQGGSSESIFWEFIKILFAKIEDEKNSGRPRFAIRNADERNTKEGRQEVKDRVELLYKEVRKKPELKGLFDAQIEGITFSAEIVSYIVSQLEKYDFIHSSVDVKGVAYETIVSPNLQGSRGEFFTPRNVVKMTVKMLDPSPGDRIYDPACGTGGFVVIAFNYISEKLRQKHQLKWKNPNKPNEKEEEELFHEIHEAGKKIFGTDFNANLVKAAQMNMIMNNDGRGGLYSENSLKNPDDWVNKDAKVAIRMGSMDFVMANPPFGVKIKIDIQEILEQYDLAHTWTKRGDSWVMESNVRNAMEPEVLFVERCVKFLKPGTGKLGIVLPDSILSNPGYAYIRYWIIQNCQLLASIDLPVETFLPNTGTQTSVLILRRKSEQEKLIESLSGQMKEYSVFMAVAKKVGKDRRGGFIYKRDKHGREILDRALYEPYIKSNLLDFFPPVETTGRMVDDDLPAIADLFYKYLKGSIIGDKK